MAPLAFRGRLLAKGRCVPAAAAGGSDSHPILCFLAAQLVILEGLNVSLGKKLRHNLYFIELDIHT